MLGTRQAAPSKVPCIFVGLIYTSAGHPSVHLCLWPQGFVQQQSTFFTGYSTASLPEIVGELRLSAV